MARRKSLLNLLKRLFSSEANTKSDKKEKKRRWTFGRLRMKRYPSLTAPPPPNIEGALSKAEEEQSKHAINMAIATTVAAEAAVAAAHVAAEVVRLTSLPNAEHQCPEDKGGEFKAVKPQIGPPGSSHQDEQEVQEFAATRIQTAFRGYLARKALRALKGIVRLQAIIRGQVVRRQAVTTLKSLQSIINIQSRLAARRNQTAEGSGDSKRFLDLRDRIIKMDCNSPRRWDDSLLSKKDVDSLNMSKIEAAIKRERVKEYSYIHRKSADSERKRGDRRYWLEQWVDGQLAKSREMEDLDSKMFPNRRLSEGYGENQPNLRGFRRHPVTEAVDSPTSARRRTLQKAKESYLTNDNSISASPIVPTYMVATESARARVRSTSSPRLRPGSYDTCSECYSPHKRKVTLSTSIRSEIPGNGRISRASFYQQRSPTLKGLPGPVKSYHMSKDLCSNS